MQLAKITDRAKVRPILAHNGNERQVTLARLGNLATRKHAHAVGHDSRHTIICGSNVAPQQFPPHRGHRNGSKSNLGTVSSKKNTKSS